MSVGLNTGFSQPSFGARKKMGPVRTALSAITIAGVTVLGGLGASGIITPHVPDAGLCWSSSGDSCGAKISAKDAVGIVTDVAPTAGLIAWLLGRKKSSPDEKQASRNGPTAAAPPDLPAAGRLDAKG